MFSSRIYAGKIFLEQKIYVRIGKEQKTEAEGKGYVITVYNWKKWKRKDAGHI
jgi:hypothetical protein